MALGQFGSGAGWGLARADRSIRGMLHTEFRFSTLAIAVLVLILVGIVVYPFSRLFELAFWSPTSGFTFQPVVEAYQSRRAVFALVNSLHMAFWATVLAIPIGLVLAWLDSRTTFRPRFLIRGTIFFLMLCPAYLNAIAWLLLASPNTGVLNRLFRWITGASPQTSIVDIYTFQGIVTVLTLSAIPYVFLTMRAALLGISSEMDEAARISGASRAKVVRKIIFPLVLPTTLSCGIITLLEGISIFGVYGMLAIPARQPAFTLQIAEYFEYPTRVDLAAAYTIPVILLTIALTAARLRMIHNRSFSSSSRLVGRVDTVDLGKANWVFAAVLTVVFALTVAFPVFVILAAALSSTWSGSVSDLSNFSLRWFAGITDSSSAISRATYNTVVIAAMRQQR